MQVTGVQVLANLTMFPWLFGAKPVDGVYWTLNFEWAFYALVFVFLVLKRNALFKIFLMVWPLCIFISAFLSLNLPYTKGYFAFFAVGGLFALIKSDKRPIVLISCFLAMLVCLVSAVGEANQLSLDKGSYFSPFVVCLLVVCQFLFFIALNFKAAENLTLPFSKTLGGLTYPLYLVHAHVGYMLISIYGNSEFYPYICLGVFCFVCAVAAVIHFYVEVGLSRYWYVFFGGVVRFFGLMGLRTLNFFRSALHK